MSLSDYSEKMDFETTLNSELGQFGKYQLINLLLLAIPCAMSGVMAGDYVFTTAKLPYRCLIPECDLQQPEYSPDWILSAIPATLKGIQDCERYESLNETIPAFDEVCPAALFNQNKTIPCESYVYERTNSVVYDFNLECKEWLRALAGTLNSAGAMIALPLAGYVSDYFGRRVSIAFFAFNVALVGLVRSFSINYAMYATLQFMQTAIGGGLFSASYILATEIVGPKYRVATSAAMSSSFALGQVYLGLIAFSVPEWRKLTLVLFVPIFSLVSYYFIVVESHRWLLSKNKKEARSALIKASRLNGKPMSDDVIDYLVTAIPKQKFDKIEDEVSLFQRVLQSPVMLRRCCTTPVLWITTTFIYYGLSINSVGLSGNIYANYMSIAAVEIPGYWVAVILLNKVGRRITLFSGFTCCAICCIAFAFISKDFYVISLILYLIGKFSTGLVITSLYLYTAELYPTRHRHSFLGFSSMLGRIGSIVSPLTPPLTVYWSGIPSVMFGTTAVISAILVLTQPETKGLKVPDTFEDAERIGKP